MAAKKRNRIYGSTIQRPPGALPRRFAQRQDHWREQGAGQSDDNEGQLPSMQLTDQRELYRGHVGRPLRHPTASDQDRTDSKNGSNAEYRDCRRAALWRETVQDHRVGGGRELRLPHADADARGEHPVMFDAKPQAAAIALHATKLTPMRFLREAGPRSRPEECPL